MFNSRLVTAVDPHGNWISPPSFVRLVQVKGRGRRLPRVGEVTSVTCVWAAAPSLVAKSSQTGWFLSADGAASVEVIKCQLSSSLL